jgi:hypothetical protein
VVGTLPSAFQRRSSWRRQLRSPDMSAASPGHLARLRTEGSKKRTKIFLVGRRALPLTQGTATSEIFEKKGYRIIDRSTVENLKLTARSSPARPHPTSFEHLRCCGGHRGCGFLAIRSLSIREQAWKNPGPTPTRDGGRSRCPRV